MIERVIERGIEGRRLAEQGRTDAGCGQHPLQSGYERPLAVGFPIRRHRRFLHRGRPLADRRGRILAAAEIAVVTAMGAAAAAVAAAVVAVAEAMGAPAPTRGGRGRGLPPMGAAWGERRRRRRR